MVLLASGECLAELKVDNVFLYLPDQAMKERIECQAEFITYLGVIKNNLEDVFQQANVVGPVSLGLVVSVRPSNDSKVWFSFLEGKLSEKERRFVSAYIEKIPAPRVQNGIVPVAFGLRIGDTETISSQPPLPPEWMPFADGKNELSVVVGKAWDEEDKKQKEKML